MPKERDYSTLEALHRGEVIDLDGIKLIKDGGIIRPGDLYVGERNTGPQLLIAKKVDLKVGCIFPTESREYPYELHECVKVREV